MSLLMQMRAADPIIGGLLAPQPGSSRICALAGLVGPWLLCAGGRLLNR